MEQWQCIEDVPPGGRRVATSPRAAKGIELNQWVGARQAYWNKGPSPREYEVKKVSFEYLEEDLFKEKYDCVVGWEGCQETFIIIFFLLDLFGL